MILGVSRKHDFTRFGLPGGKVDPGETFLQALAREVREETGLEVVGPSPIYVAVCRGQVDYLNVTYRGSVSGELFTNEPVAIDWITREKLLEGPFRVYLQDMFQELSGCATN